MGPASSGYLAGVNAQTQVEKGVLIGGDDFKSGQTKMKSVLVDFLVGAGIKPTSIVSYNHLGNNDGMNLSAPQTFRSKVRRRVPNACLRHCHFSSSASCASQVSPESMIAPAAQVNPDVSPDLFSRMIHDSMQTI